MSDSANTLCERARAGDREAASELIALLYERIYAYLRRLCASDEDAADLTQRTFAKAWGSLSSFQGRSSFSTWLHGVAHHTWLDARRQRNLGEAKPDDWWEACSADAPNPLEDASERDLAKQLYALVDRLDDDQRQTVHLHYYQDLSLAETAEALGVATSTVKYRLREALNALRSGLAEPKSRLLSALPQSHQTSL